MGWRPGEFWASTFHDFTAVMWARRDAAGRGETKREMSAAEAAAALGGMARHAR